MNSAKLLFNKINYLKRQQLTVVCINFANTPIRHCHTHSSAAAQVTCFTPDKNAFLKSINRLNHTRSLNNLSQYRMIATEKQQQQQKPKLTCKEVDIPLPWGHLKAQIFGDITTRSKPIVSLHGFLDNSNSFKPISPYLTQNGDYYIIAIDLPGHGFSSHLPLGIPYSMKLTMIAIRRAIKHFNLNRFTFVSHSYGAVCSCMYTAIYPKEVEALVLFDPIVNLERGKEAKKNALKLWSISIDNHIEHDDRKGNNGAEADDSLEKPQKSPLTREIALEKLLKANKHLDEASAQILLDRALIVKENKLEFSRDTKAKLAMKTPAHYLDMYHLAELFHESISCPLLYAYASPASYGEASLTSSIEFFTHLKEKSKDSFQITKVENTHHFHMIQPEITAEMVKQFLKKFQTNQNNNQQVKAESKL